MNRRSFFGVLAGLAGAAVLPTVLPEPALPPITESIYLRQEAKLYMSQEELDDVYNWGVDYLSC
jgi:hypothetical protein